MLELAHRGLHRVAQMTSQTAMRQCVDAGTVNAAKVLGLAGYGLAPGGHADFVLPQARDPVAATRLRATRLKVFKRGKLLPATPAATRQRLLAGGPRSRPSGSDGQEVPLCSHRQRPVLGTLKTQNHSIRSGNVAQWPQTACSA